MHREATIPVLFACLIAYARFDGAFATSPDYSNVGQGILTFPSGTSWCSHDSSASGTDSIMKCCEQHTNCPYRIEAGSEKYGQLNKRNYIISSCECDKAFRKCLDSTGEKTAGTMGNIYFSIINPDCFNVYTNLEECQSRDLPIVADRDEATDNVACIEWQHNAKWHE